MAEENAAQSEDWDAFAPVAGGDQSAAPPKEEDAWENFAPATDVGTQDTNDLAMAGQQFSAGVAEGATGVAGMLKGASMAMKVPIPHPGLKAGLVVLGGATGLFGGSAVAEKALEFFGVESPEDLPEEQRPLAYGARSLGGAAPFAAAPMLAAQRGVVLVDQGVGKIANQIIRTAKESPKAFAAIEASGAITAATAAGVAESVAPGEAGVRVGAEIAGGILAPANMSVKAYRSTSKVVKDVIRKMTPQARETQAAKQLQEMLALSNEDPTTLVEILKIDEVLDANGTPIDATLTSAQRTGSEALSALQKFLADSNPDFKASVARKEKDALDALRGVAVSLTKTGDPEALQTAAEVKSQYVRSLLQTLVDNQTQKALMQARTITDDTPDAIGGISTAAREALDTTVAEVRKAESALWEVVPKNIDSGISNVEQTFNTLKADMLPELVSKRMPSVVSDFLERKAKEAKGFTPESSIIVVPNYRATQQTIAKSATTGELKQLRSTLTDMAREATKSGDFGQARIYSDLANAALDDIDQAFVDVGDEAYDAARSFSREMHEVFSRSFVGKATSQGKYGDRIAPELMLRKAMASGKEAGAMQFQQLEEATRFLDAREMGNDVTQEAADVMLDAQDRFTRLMFAGAIDPVTGLVNAKRMSALMRENDAMLNRFPRIREQLTDAVTSELQRKGIEDFAKGKVRYMEQMKLFEKLSGKEPITMARRALASPNMEREIQNMINVTKGGGVAGFDSQEALKGVSASVLSAALKTSTDATGTLNLDKFRAVIGQPPVGGKKSPLDVLKAKGAIDAQHHAAIEDVFGLLEKIEKSGKPGHAVTTGEDVSDVALSFLSRVAGTTAVGAAAKTTGTSGSIQAHAAGANLANHLTRKMTSVRMDEIFMRALNDKDFMITLLEKVDTAQAAELQARQMNAWLFQSAIDFADIENEEEQ